MAVRKGDLSGVRQGRFFRGNFDALLLQIEPDPAEDTHVHVGYPDQREARDQIASPVWKQKFVAGDDQEDCRDVVAETIFASEKVEELSLVDTPAGFALGNTIIAKFAYDLFMGDGPSHRGYRQSDYEER